MSQPNITAAEYRKRYLATLRLQNNINNKNLQANALLVQTGQPAPLSDTRTITEKVSDVAGLDNLLRKELLTITDANNASEIIQKLDTQEKQFIITQFTAIEREIKSRFKSGVPAPAFIAFLQKYIDKYETTKGVEAPLEEQLAPVEELAKSISASQEKKAKGKTEGTGEFSSNLPPADDLQKLNKTQVRSFFSKVKKELTRQIREETELTPEQVQIRKLIKKQLDSVPNGSAQGYIEWSISRPELYARLNDILGGVSGAGIMGKGLLNKVAKPSQSIKKAIRETGAGIPVADRFAKLGRYVIDKSKLDDNIIACRFPSGACVPDFPAKRVSKSISSVVKKIIGGNMPSYDEIEALNGEERNYLYGLSKKTKIQDQVKIPAPKKDEEAKEMDRFDILKGQILAGNDNKDLVKEFKLKLLRFAREGRVPRKEAQDILVELASIGL